MKVIILLISYCFQVLCYHIIDNNNYINNNATLDEDEAINGLLNIFGGGNPQKTPDGEPIIDGDIVYVNTFENYVHNDIDDEVSARKAIRYSLYYWPNGVIPYTFHTSVKPKEKEVILKAIQHWENETCIRFKEKTNDLFFIRFRTDTNGCWSLIGRQASKYKVGQDVSIGKGCADWKTVTHELGHVIGFYHEQSRSDRNKAIHINWENIKPGYNLQFHQVDDINFGVDYDISSIMQYSEWAFSKDILAKNTIVTLEPRYQRFLGRYLGLTFRDRKAANALYSCNSRCLNRETFKCLNGGYVRDHGTNGTECKCDCPPNTYGDICEYIRTTSYYDAIWPLPCGSNITEPGIIQTPNYPRRLSPYESCVWTIYAPERKMIKLTFNGFSFLPRNKRPNTMISNKCVKESIEIRLESDFDGIKYCDKDISPGQEFLSERGKAIIIILADDTMTGTGLQAKVEFIDK